MTQLPGRFLSWFWGMLDSETVRLFVWPYYMALFAFAVVAEALVPPVNILSKAMGVTHYTLWVWVMFIGTLSVMFGLLLRHGGKPVEKMNTPLLFADWMGLCLQTGGHLCMFWVLLDFEIYAARSITWWEDVIRIFAVFAISPYVVGCVFLALQVARKLWYGEKLHRITRKVGVLQLIEDS